MLSWLALAVGQGGLVYCLPQDLSCKEAGQLEALWVGDTMLIKRCMVTCFDNYRCCINVSDVLVCGSIPNEDASVVVVVQFSVTLTRCLDTHTRPKHLKVGNVRLSIVPCFVWCHFCGRVDESIVEID